MGREAHFGNSVFSGWLSTGFENGLKINLELHNAIISLLNGNLKFGFLITLLTFGFIGLFSLRKTSKPTKEPVFYFVFGFKKQFCPIKLKT